jgi:hypothetical protein
MSKADPEANLYKNLSRIVFTPADTRRQRKNLSEVKCASGK